MSWLFIGQIKALLGKASLFIGRIMILKNVQIGAHVAFGYTDSLQTQSQDGLYSFNVK